MGPPHSLGCRGVSDQKVVRFNVSVDYPRAVEQLHQAQQLRHQVESQGLNDLFVCGLGQVDKVEERAHPLVLRYQDVAVPVAKTSWHRHESILPTSIFILQRMRQFVISEEGTDNF